MEMGSLVREKAAMLNRKRKSVRTQREGRRRVLARRADGVVASAWAETVRKIFEAGDDIQRGVGAIHSYEEEITTLEKRLSDMDTERRAEEDNLAAVCFAARKTDKETISDYKGYTEWLGKKQEETIRKRHQIKTSFRRR